MVNIATMDAVVTSVIEQCDAFGCIATHRDWPPGDPLPHAEHWGPRQIEAGTRIGKALFLLTGRAVHERYGDDPDEVPDCAFTPRPDIDPVQRFKCVEYLLYLCHEGRVPETEGYKALERAGDLLARHIVTKSREYREASWGLR
jgi:hypothetical protein